MKIVLDTNVLVSGILSPNGPPAAVLRALLTERVTLCFDERIVSEYRDVLTRTKVSEHAFTEEGGDRFLQDFPVESERSRQAVERRWGFNGFSDIIAQ